MTAIARAPPINGLPGIFVMTSTVAKKDGVAFTTPPNPTTAAVLAMAIMAPIAPAANVVPTDLAYL